MRIEHCRRCEIEMLPSPDRIGACIVCSEPQKLLCTKCNEKTLLQVHSHDFKENHGMKTLAILHGKLEGVRY